MLLDASLMKALGKIKPVNAKTLEVDLLSKAIELKKMLSTLGKLDSIKSGMLVHEPRMMNLF